MGSCLTERGCVGFRMPYTREPEARGLSSIRRVKTAKTKRKKEGKEEEEEKVEEEKTLVLFLQET